MLLLIEKHTDTSIEQTKAKPQETLDFKMNKQTQTFAFNPPIRLVEDSKWFLAVDSIECTISGFKKTNSNKSFSFSIPGHWESKSAEKTIDELNKLLELRPENDFELHTEQVRKKICSN